MLQTTEFSDDEDEPIGNIPSGHYYLAEIRNFSGNSENFKVKKLLLDRVLWVCCWSRTMSILKELSAYGTKSLRGAYLEVVFRLSSFLPSNNEPK